MSGLPLLAVLLQRGVRMLLQLCEQASAQGRQFLGGTTRDRFGQQAACLTPLLEVALDGGEGDTKQLDNFDTWHALIDGMQHAFSEILRISFHASIVSYGSRLPQPAV